MRSKLNPVLLFLLLSIAVVPPATAGTVSAYWISSSAQLLSGSYSDGRVSDVMMENDSIAVVITAMGHTEYYGVSGGNIIDAGSSIDRIDALAELYTYFNNEWPRQANYSSLSIIDDGTGGDPAVVRTSGVDTDNPSIAVVTDYILDVDALFVTISTTVTNNGGSAINSFELGDGFAWGSCEYFAPGYGFSLSGVTYEPWLAGTSYDGVSYGYCSAWVNTIWGDHGGGWSDVNDTTANLAPGGSCTYDRHLAVGGRDIASVATIIHEVKATPAGSLSCTVTAPSTGGPPADSRIEAYDDSDDHYLQMVPDLSGDAFTTLPAGDWRLLATAPGYVSEETWVTTNTGGMESHDFSLYPDTTFPAVGDTLTIIQRPLLNIPSMILPGDTLPIECDAPPATTGWAAGLIRNETTVPLTIVASSYDPSTEWWTLSAEIPDVPVYDLYDLFVTADGGMVDTTWNAVKVIEQFKDDFYFIQITDPHLPTHLYYYENGSDTDTSEINDLRAVIEDVGVINPEFVLITGDYINEGELEDYLYKRYFTRTQRLLAEFDVPTYLTSGNHDIGGWDSTPPPDGTARRNWWRFFGWKRLNDPPAGAPWYTQNYSFDYGPVHFTGLEAYNNYDGWRYNIYGSDSFTSGQMSWLADDLAAASASVSQVLFYHMDFSNQINLSSLDAEMALWGHIHSSSGNINSPPYDLSTDNVCDGARSFRLVRVSNGLLQPRNTLSAGSYGQNLTVDYTPANDGTNSTVTAEIDNNTGERFEHGLIRFQMPGGGGSAEVTGGTLLQIDDSGPVDVYYVGVDILASSTRTVTINIEATDVAVGAPSLPEELRLGRNHPNPFNPRTSISYDLPAPGPVRLVVFDTRGRETATLVDGHQTAGEHHAVWNGEDHRGRPVPSGVYYARLSAGGDVRTRKIVLTR